MDPKGISWIWKIDGVFDKYEAKVGLTIVDVLVYTKSISYLFIIFFIWKVDLIIKTNLFINPKKLKYFFLKTPILIIDTLTLFSDLSLFKGPFSGKTKWTEWPDFIRTSIIEIKILLAP